MNKWKKGGYKTDRYFVLATNDLTDGEIQMISDIEGGLKKDRFVLDFKDDPHAQFALSAYAYSVRDENKKLADDLMGLLEANGASKAIFKREDAKSMYIDLQRDKIKQLQANITDSNDELNRSMNEYKQLASQYDKLVEGKNYIDFELVKDHEQLQKEYDLMQALYNKAQYDCRQSEITARQYKAKLQSIYNWAVKNSEEVTR